MHIIYVISILCISMLYIYIYIWLYLYYMHIFVEFPWPSDLCIYDIFLLTFDIFLLTFHFSKPEAADFAVGSLRDCRKRPWLGFICCFGAWEGVGCPKFWVYEIWVIILMITLSGGYWYTDTWMSVAFLFVCVRAHIVWRAKLFEPRGSHFRAPCKGNLKLAFCAEYQIRLFHCTWIILDIDLCDKGYVASLISRICLEYDRSMYCWYVVLVPWVFPSFAHPPKRWWSSLLSSFP